MRKNNYKWIVKSAEVTVESSATSKRKAVRNARYALKDQGLDNEDVLIVISHLHPELNGYIDIRIDSHYVTRGNGVKSKWATSKI